MEGKRIKSDECGSRLYVRSETAERLKRLAKARGWYAYQLADKVLSDWIAAEEERLHMGADT